MFSVLQENAVSKRTLVARIEFPEAVGNRFRATILRRLVGLFPVDCVGYIEQEHEALLVYTTYPRRADCKRDLDKLRFNLSRFGPTVEQAFEKYVDEKVTDRMLVELYRNHRRKVRRTGRAQRRRQWASIKPSN